MKAAWVGSQVGWGGVSRSYQREANHVIQVDGYLDMVAVCLHVG